MIKDTKIAIKGKGVVKTPEVRFTLKEPKSKTATLIRAVYRYNKKKLVYSTQHKILPKHWEKKKQLPRISYKFYNELKGDIDSIQTAIVEVYKENKPKNNTEFRDKLNIKLGRSEDQGPATQTFLQFVEDLIERKKNKKDVKPNTIKRYVSIKNKLINFQKQSGKPLNYDDISYSFRDHFTQWLYEKTSTKSQNTVNKDLSMIKVLMEQAHKERLHSNLIFKEKDFNVKTVKTTKVALEEKEVEKLYKFKNFKSKLFKEKGITPLFAKKVRDWFLVSCYSSLRWGDFTKIKPDNLVEIKGDKYLHTWTEKTNEEVYIPINQKLITILNKYDFQSSSFSSQRFNEAIKVVCDAAGIRSKVIMISSDKGEIKSESVRKCDVISAHTGRRTWASINYSKGFPILLLMQVTGHTKESTFLSYIGISKKKMAIKLMQQMKAQESKLKVV